MSLKTEKYLYKGHDEFRLEWWPCRHKLETHTDPECPYCRIKELEKSWRVLISKKEEQDRRIHELEEWKAKTLLTDIDIANQRIRELEAKLERVRGAVYEGCDSGCAESVRKALADEK